MRGIDLLFQNNRDRSARRAAQDPGYFERLARRRSRRYLWIGCSDCRVPANEIVGPRRGRCQYCSVCHAGHDPVSMDCGC